jgi:hypothetical protein
MSFRAPALVLALSLASVAVAAADETTLPVVIRCEACDASARPAVSLAWMTQGLPTMSSIEAVDWVSGKFVGAMLDGKSTVTFDVLATSIDATTWQIDVPLPERDGVAVRPFRAVVTLPGHAASHAVAWPSRDPGPVTFELTPVAQILDENPTWDPKRTPECEVLIPKSAAAPVTFYAAGSPRAWLYLPPARDASSEDAWIFQFVRPGASLLERLSVAVTAFDEGDEWAFRLPLQAVSAEPVAGEKAVAPLRTMRVGSALTIALDDCPRETR